MAHFYTATFTDEDGMRVEQEVQRALDKEQMAQLPVPSPSPGGQGFLYVPYQILQGCLMQVFSQPDVFVGQAGAGEGIVGDTTMNGADA